MTYPTERSKTLIDWSLPIEYVVRYAKNEGTILRVIATNLRGEYDVAVLKTDVDGYEEIIVYDRFGNCTNSSRQIQNIKKTYTGWIIIYESVLGSNNWSVYPKIFATEDAINPEYFSSQPTFKQKISWKA